MYFRVLTASPQVVLSRRTGIPVRTEPSPMKAIYPEDLACFLSPRRARRPDAPVSRSQNILCVNRRIHQMKHRLVLLLVLFSISFSISAQAQTWSGILDPSRAIDWTQAGVVGGIPSATWTQCGSTIAAGASAATINTAISNCTPGTLPANGKYVQLGAGTFNLTQSIHIAKSGVVLRGMGAKQTHLV